MERVRKVKEVENQGEYGVLCKNLVDNIVILHFVSRNCAKKINKSLVCQICQVFLLSNFVLYGNQPTLYVLCHIVIV